MSDYEKISEQLETLGKVLSEKQKEIDEKTKDVKAYKECNEKLVKLIKLVVGGFLIVVICLFMTLGYTISQYKSLESSVNTTTETKRQEFQTEDGGVIINGSNNSGDVNGGQ